MPAHSVIISNFAQAVAKIRNQPEIDSARMQLEKVFEIEGALEFVALVSAFAGVTRCVDASGHRAPSLVRGAKVVRGVTAVKKWFVNSFMKVSSENTNGCG